MNRRGFLKLVAAVAFIPSLPVPVAGPVAETWPADLFVGTLKNFQVPVLDRIYAGTMNTAACARLPSGKVYSIREAYKLALGKWVRDPIDEDMIADLSGLKEAA